jgi:hypothetical protein
MRALFQGSILATALLTAACSPPPECATIFEVRDQDQKTLDDAATYGDSIDPKQLADNGRAYHDAAKKLQTNAARLDALAPSDHTLGRFVKAYTATVKPIVLALDALGARFEGIAAAQAKVAAANDKLQAARAKMAAACQTGPTLAGCSETKSALAQVPKDENGRKQTVRDLETVKMDPTLVPIRAEIIAALHDMDAARKELDKLELDPKASYTTTALATAGTDLEKQCGKK